MTNQTIELDHYYDVIIVGAGAAGMAAAIQAKDEGASPVIFEKMPAVRGNTIKSSAGMNASGSKFQFEQGIEDSNELFYEETFKGGNRTNDPDLLKFFVEHSSEAIDWLDSLGISLSNLTTTGGMSRKRTHRPSNGSAIGGYLVKGLLANIEDRKIPVIVNAEVREIMTDGDSVCGIEVSINNGELKTVRSKAVLITTGGFGFNRAMINDLVSGFEDYITTNHQGSMGEGIKLIQKIGGAVRDLEQIQIHPTVHQESGFLMTEAIRGEGAILISPNGERFINELERRDVVSKAIMAIPSQYAYLLFDDTLKKRVPAVGFYQSKQMVHMGETLNDLAERINVKTEVLEETVKKWNTCVTSFEDVTFGRHTGMEHAFSSAPFYAIKVAPGIHHTMGGVIINKKAEVQTDEGCSIKGLYAAGETVGGLHGENRIGGNAIAETIVYGRQAGSQAAHYTSSSF